jgi:Ca-activated chloride channel family protein
MIRRLVVAALAFLLPATGIAACGGGDTTLTVIAGSELKDLEPLLDQIAEDTGYRLDFTYTGTLTGAERVLGGEEFDLAWFSHAKYLELLAASSGLVKASEPVMLSPVVLGVKQSRADQWGWSSGVVTWADIAARAEAGEFRFAMTNPTASNSGFTALIGVATAFAGTGAALSATDIPTEEMQSFFNGLELTAGSSGWLADSYVESQATLDGLVNYESVLLSLNAEPGLLAEPLTLVYPADGIVTADYPLMLLNESQREAHTELVDYLRSPAMQETIGTTTLRRPAVPGVNIDSRIPDAVLVEVPFPGSLAVVDELLFSYLDDQRAPAHTYYVLDASGSMEGEPIESLRIALKNLTGLDTSVTGQFARFRLREEVTLIVFSDYVESVVDFVISDTDPNSAEFRRFREFVDSGLVAGGGTALYDALLLAYEMAGAAKEADKERFYSIVLLSDGEANEGLDYGEFDRAFSQLHEDAQAIRTFPILFGDASEDEMHALAELTRGRVFDSAGDLAQVFKTIRGYQ